MDAVGQRIETLERELAGLRASIAPSPTAPSPTPTGPEAAALAQLLDRGALLPELPEIIVILDRSHRLRYANRPGPERYFKALTHPTPGGLFRSSERARAIDHFERTWQTGERHTFTTHSTNDRWWETRVAPIAPEGEPVLLLTTTIEITERKRAEAALLASESRLRHAIEATGMGTWSSGVEDGAIELDSILLGSLGCTPECAPKTLEEFLELVHPDDRAVFTASLEAIRDRRAFTDVECRLQLQDGTVRHVLSKGTLLLDADGQVTGSYGGVIDITERKRLERRLEHARRMEAIGQLTAGVAHHFNNALGVILPNAELCRRTAAPDAAPRLDDIVRACERAAEVTRALSLFTRHDGSATRRPFDLGACVRHLVDRYEAAFGPTIPVTVSIAPELPRALGKAQQVEQVLLGILWNARDALLAAPCLAPAIHIELGSGPSDALRVRITDNGCGMDESVRARVFEPFFSTKGSHESPGLGLAVAYAIVMEHEGAIRCQSRLGEGTTIEIDLPSAAHPWAHAAVTAEGQEAAAARR